jgi:hypothetical protein
MTSSFHGYDRGLKPISRSAFPPKPTTAAVLGRNHPDPDVSYGRFRIIPGPWRVEPYSSVTCMLGISYACLPLELISAVWYSDVARVAVQCQKGTSEWVSERLNCWTNVWLR